MKIRSSIRRRIRAVKGRLCWPRGPLVGRLRVPSSDSGLVGLRPLRMYWQVLRGLQALMLCTAADQPALRGPFPASPACGYVTRASTRPSPSPDRCSYDPDRWPAPPLPATHRALITGARTSAPRFEQAMLTFHPTTAPRRAIGRET